MAVKQQFSNDEIILNYIRRNGSVSKASIARNTGITPPTVTNICASLAQKDLIYGDRQERSALGRPSMLLKFKAETETLLVIHVRTHAILWYVVTADGEILKQRKKSIIGLSTEEVSKLIMTGTESILLSPSYNKAPYRIQAIGLILRGPVDSSKGISIYSPHAKWTNVPFKYILEERFQLPVYVENDVRCLSTGEYYYGRGKNIDNLLVLKFSYGLGASLIYEGSLYRGFNDSAGEIGYTIINFNDDGSYTHLEDVASETAIREYVLAKIAEGRDTSVKDNKEILDDAFRVEPIYEAAVQGDELCLEALNRVGKYLGGALANLCNLMNPERVILSSAMGNAVSIMDPILRDVIERNLHKVHPVDLAYSGNGAYYTLLGMVDIICCNRAGSIWINGK